MFVLIFKVLSNAFRQVLNRVNCYISVTVNIIYGSEKFFRDAKIWEIVHFKGSGLILKLN